jgi:uncharacterized protein YjbI with pentapeptide repeats
MAVARRSLTPEAFKQSDRNRSTNMGEPIVVTTKDISLSSFHDVNMTGSRFDDVNLSNAVFYNINLRGARFGGIDFGGAEFSCMNTGEGRPRVPASFTNMEFDGCRFHGGSFARAAITDANVEGMTINGLPVDEMITVYRRYVGR